MTNLATTNHPQVAELEAELEEHRTALTGYCYRMLGSAFEAEDAVQETMVRAWRGFDRYEGRSSVRSWLFRIATNVCIDLLNGRKRRALPMDVGPASDGEHAVGAATPGEWWVQPVPDGRVIAAGDPAEVATARDTIRLAFVVALQHLAPRPRAVLILRDVLGWQASEVATLLDATPTSIHSVLQRARRTLADRVSLAPASGDVDEDLLASYVDAFERYDVERLVALLHHDATMSMPPFALWLRGPAAIERWWRGHGSDCARLGRIVRTNANGCAAFALYRPAVDGTPHAFAIQVIETGGGRITGIHAFLEPSLFPLFGLPEVLPRSTP